MASVDVTGIRKSFGSLEVLHGVDVAIGDGEFIVLVGPSGCGKSTLLRMIAGLEEVDKGTIAIGGQVVNDVRPKDRDIAMVFQSYALYPHMTTRDNMAFGLRMRGASKQRIEEGVGSAVGILGLQALLDRFPRQLSGGQRQRVAMGRAIVRDPKVFLFDEPLSNLDAKLRVQMRTEIKALHQRLGITTVYVTHDQIEAMTMADKIVVLNAGRVEQIGSPLQLYDRPVNMFVAGFLGSPSMNFLKGTARSNSHPGIALADGSVIQLDAVPATAGGSVVLGVRPEDIYLDSEGGAPARVIVVEPTGAETHLAVELGGHELTCVLRERVSLQANETVKLSFRRSASHFFDPVSTNRIQQRPAG
jgi:multiple sugar transport system ATP-binding protein